MLNEGVVHPTFPITNIDRAKKYYGETPGLKTGEEIAPGHILRILTSIPVPSRSFRIFDVSVFP